MTFLLPDSATKAIADTLCISPVTVSRHLANLRKRFRVHSALALLRLLLKPWREDTAPLLFTSREKEIFLLTMEGLSSREIGGRLAVSHSTVKRHKENMLLKNNCATMRELMAAYLESRSQDV